MIVLNLRYSAASTTSSVTQEKVDDMLDRWYKSCPNVEEYFILIGVRPQGDQSWAQQLLWGAAEALENLLKVDPDAAILPYSKAYEECLKPLIYIQPIFLKLIKRYLKQEDTNRSYEEPKPQGAKRRPDAKKGGPKPPHHVNPFHHF